MHPNFVSHAREISIFCEDCKLAAPLGFPGAGALGLVFVSIYYVMLVLFCGFFRGI